MNHVVQTRQQYDHMQFFFTFLLLLFFYFLLFFNYHTLLKINNQAQTCNTYTQTPKMPDMWFVQYRQWYDAHLSYQPVDEHWLHLSVSVDPEYSLQIVGRVPTGVKDDYSVSRDKIDP